MRLVKKGYTFVKVNGVWFYTLKEREISICSTKLPKLIEYLDSIYTKNKDKNIDYNQYNCNNCINCNYCINCYDCTDCAKCYNCYDCNNCISCNNCINCNDLIDKQRGYWIDNEEVSKELFDSIK